jgi:hypothetical protein
VLRAYLEARFRWPASAATTVEIEVACREARWMGLTQLDQARRILEATDRLKFARQGGGSAFFEELDADFGAVIQATIPLPPLPGQGVADA